MVALKLQQFKCNLFFGAQYFLCFFVKVTVHPMRGGGDYKEGGVHTPRNTNRLTPSAFMAHTHHPQLYAPPTLHYQSPADFFVGHRKQP